MLNLLIDTILGWLIDFVQDLFNALFSSDLTNILMNIAAPEQLASSIPYIDVLFKAMDAIAWIFLVVCAYSVIIKVIVSQFGGDGSSENPIKSVIKIFIAAAMISFRPQMMRLVAFMFSKLYGLMPGGMMAVNDLSWWSNASPVKMFTRVVLVCMVAFGAIGAALAYLERVFSFLIFMYTYPIAVAFSVNKETSDMFRQWIIGVISQMIMIILSSGMMYMAVNLLNIATNQTFMEHVTFFQDSVNIFAFFLAINAMSLVKNSEKILNMYNIRTMPNQDTVSCFSGAFHKALAIGTGAAALTLNTASDIGHVMFGAPAAPVTGSGGGTPITPSGSSEQIFPKDGGNYRSSTWSTTKEVIGVQGKEYATKASRPGSVAGVDDNSPVSEKLTLEKAEVPTTNQKMSEAYSRKIMDGGVKTKTAAGYVFQKSQGIRNFNEFSSSVDSAINEINQSRDKVNMWLQDNSSQVSEGNENGVRAPLGSEPLRAEDVYKGYGMANDKTLKDFSPEGFAVPVYKDGKLDGLMIKGRQTDTRSGKMSEKKIYVSSDNVQKSDGQLGANGEWTVDTSGFHQITPNAYAYDVKPSKVVSDKKGSSDADDVMHKQAQSREKATQIMETGTYNYEKPSYINRQNETRTSGSSINRKAQDDFHMPEQPDQQKLKTKLAEVDPGRFEAERKESTKENKSVKAESKDQKQKSEKKEKKPKDIPNKKTDPGI